MSELETLPAETTPAVDVITETGEPTVAHIVKVAPGESAAAKVLQARIEGTPVEALCGHVWVPARDPKQLPVCQACKEIYDMFRIFNDGLRDSPSD
jgi:tRNA(Ile2) C34 agmatinyltransferase TiaS